MQDDQIPDAVNPDEEAPEQPEGMQLPPMPPLVIGDPFAIGYGAQFKDVSEAPPGSTIVIQCEGTEARPCEQPFKINLLDAGYKSCPRCGQTFTHMLLLAPADDDEIIRDAIVTVLQANGIGYELEHEGELDQGDDGEGDQGA